LKAVEGVGSEILIIAWLGSPFLISLCYHYISTWFFI